MTNRNGRRRVQLNLSGQSRATNLNRSGPAPLPPRLLLTDDLAQRVQISESPVEKKRWLNSSARITKPSALVILPPCVRLCWQRCPGSGFWKPVWIYKGVLGYESSSWQDGSFHFLPFQLPLRFFFFFLKKTTFFKSCCLPGMRCSLSNTFSFPFISLSWKGRARQILAGPGNVNSLLINNANRCFI